MVSVLESLMKKDSFIHMKLRDCVASVGGEKDCSHVLLPTNALIGPGRHREGDSLRGSRGTRKWLLGLTFFSFLFFFFLHFVFQPSGHMECISEHTDQEMFS